MAYPSYARGRVVQAQPVQVVKNGSMYTGASLPVQAMQPVQVASPCASPHNAASVRAASPVRMEPSAAMRAASPVRMEPSAAMRAASPVREVGFPMNGNGAPAKTASMEDFKQALATKVFDMFDTDHNGELTRAELDAALKMLQEQSPAFQSVPNTVTGQPVALPTQTVALPTQTVIYQAEPLVCPVVSTQTIIQTADLTQARGIMAGQPGGIMPAQPAVIMPGQAGGVVQTREVMPSNDTSLVNQSQDALGSTREPQESMAEEENKNGFLQCVCGSLFLDDSTFCRKCGADRSIAEALLEIECNEALFAEELSKLPGGEDALRWLRGLAGDEVPPGWEVREDPNTGQPIYVNPKTGETTYEKPVGTGEDFKVALEQIKTSVKIAKAKAIQEAREQKQKASTIEKSATDALEMAHKAMMDDRHNELEHQMLTGLAQKQREAEAKADADLQRLTQLAQEAAANAQALMDDHAEADAHHQHRKGLHNEVKQRTLAAKHAAAQGLPPDQAQKQAKAKQEDAEKRYLSLVQQSERSKGAADAAAKKVEDKTREIEALEHFRQRGLDGKESLEHAETYVGRAHRAQAHANRLRQKADTLKQQAQDMLREAEYAEQVAQQAEQHAAEQAQIAAEQTVKAREIGLSPEDQSQHALSPEEARQKIMKLKGEIGAAQQEMKQQEQRAQALANAAENAHKEINDLEDTMEAFDALPQLEEEEALHALDLDHAKAKAEHAKAAAEAAKKHAELAHQRTQEAQKKLQDQSAMSDLAHKKEREAWAKRFGEHDGHCGVCGAEMPPDAEACPQCGAPNNGLKEVNGAETEAQREVARAQQLAVQAAQAEAAAKKAEADAYKLEMIVKALERARDLAEKLRPTRCECGEMFSEDANFCRACGRPRMQQWAWQGQTSSQQSVYGDGVHQVRTEAKLAKADIEGLKAKAEQGPPETTAAKVVQVSSAHTSIAAPAPTSIAAPAQTFAQPATTRQLPAQQVVTVPAGFKIVGATPVTYPQGATYVTMPQATARAAVPQAYSAFASAPVQTLS